MQLSENSHSHVRMSARISRNDVIVSKAGVSITLRTSRPPCKTGNPGT